MGCKENLEKFERIAYPTPYVPDNRKNLKWIVAALLVIAVVTAVVFYFVIAPSVFLLGDNTRSWVYPEEVVARGAVVSNGGPCAAIGQKILKKYGNAVDSLIATMLCDGITCPSFLGVGGGFMATIYRKNDSTKETIIAREAAPAAATKEMFTKDFSLSKRGGLAVAVPGELKGYWELYNKYGGKAPWEELFADAIDLCRNGIIVTERLEKEIIENKDDILRTPSLKKILLNEKGELAKMGDKIKRPKLAETLTLIAKGGPDVLYNGSLTAGFVKDIQDNGGIITEEDMKSYNIRWKKPIHVPLTSGINFYSVGPPASGHLLGFMLRVLNNTLKQDMDLITNVSIITETFKYAYAMRSHFGDPDSVDITESLQKLSDHDYIEEVKNKILTNKTNNDPENYGAFYYNREDYGTANIAVVAPNGDAVSATSTINLAFGSGLVSESTGILLNNQMDDFSTPGLVNGFGVHPSPTNFIAPGKRPQSSVCPSILIDKDGDVRLAVGAAGGTKITTAVALTIIRNIWEKKPIAEAVDQARFHHQLMAMEWGYEHSMPLEIVSAMKARGHKVSLMDTTATVTAISKNGDIIGASSDIRRPGNTSYLLIPCSCKK